MCRAAGAMTSLGSPLVGRPTRNAAHFFRRPVVHIVLKMFQDCRPPVFVSMWSKYCTVLRCFPVIVKYIRFDALASPALILIALYFIYCHTFYYLNIPNVSLKFMGAFKDYDPHNCESFYFICDFFSQYNSIFKFATKKLFFEFILWNLCFKVLFLLGKILNVKLESCYQPPFSRYDLWLVLLRVPRRWPVYNAV